MLANVKFTTATVKLSGFQKKLLYKTPSHISHATLTNCQVANTEDDTIYITVQYSRGDTNEPFVFVRRAAVPTGSALNALVDTVNLTPGDRVSVVLEYNSAAEGPLVPSADVYASIQEYTNA